MFKNLLISSTLLLLMSNWSIGQTYQSKDFNNNFASTLTTNPSSPTSFSGTSASDLVINEIMYNPAEGGVDSTEFIEIYNNGSVSVDLTDFTLTGGIYTFPSVSIAAGAYYVVAVNTSAFTNVYGFAPHGEFTNGLSNSGESIVLKDNLGVLLDSVYYRPVAPWPTGSAVGTANGGGASLILCDPNSDNNDGANWKASTTPVGITINSRPVLASPNAANSCPIINPDIEATGFLGLNSTYCNITTISGSIVLKNIGAVASNKVYYTISANGFPIVSDSLATIADMDSAIIPLGPIPTATGVVNLVLTTTSANDINTANNTTSFNVSVSNIAATINLTNPILCHGDSDAVLMASATNGLANPYNYLWSANAGSQTTENITGLAIGIYAVTVTDSIGCADSSIITITEPTVLNLSSNSGNVSCNAGTDGVSNITVNGGTGAYAFVWSNGATTAGISGLSAGIFSCTVADANNCTDTVITIITEPTVLLASVVDNADGSATVAATGGTSPYSYIWDLASGSQTTATATGLIGNTTYAVTVTDTNTCTDSSTITIILNSIATIANSTKLNVFPNPTSGNIFVDFDLANRADIQITILNSVGQTTLSKVLNNIQLGQIELETANLNAGVYMIQFLIGNEQITKKILIYK